MFKSEIQVQFDPKTIRYIPSYATEATGRTMIVSCRLEVEVETGTGKMQLRAWGDVANTLIPLITADNPEMNVTISRSDFSAPVIDKNGNKITDAKGEFIMVTKFNWTILKFQPIHKSDLINKSL